MSSPLLSNIGQVLGLAPRVVSTGINPADGPFLGLNNYTEKVYGHAYEYQSI